MPSSAPPPSHAPHSETPDATINPPPPPTPPSSSIASDAKDTERQDLSSAGEATAVAGEAESSGGGGAEGEEEEEEETECGFCLFMKGGGCKDSFVAWELCVEEAEKTSEDVVDKCSEVTSLLKKCMDAHADYYEPILRAEQVMAEAVEDTDLEN